MDNKLRVLQIEDDKVWLDIVKRWFSRKDGFTPDELVQQDSIIGAIEAIHDPSRPKFDVLLVDVTIDIPLSTKNSSGSKINDLIKVIDAIEHQPRYQQRPRIIALSGAKNLDEVQMDFNDLRPGWISNWYGKNTSTNELALKQRIMGEMQAVKREKNTPIATDHVNKRFDAWAIVFIFFLLVPIGLILAGAYFQQDLIRMVVFVVLYLVALMIILPYICLWRGLVDANQVNNLLNAPVETIKQVWVSISEQLK